MVWCTVIISVFVLPILVKLSKLVTSLLCAKIDEIQKNIHNDKVNHYIDHAEDMIITSVDAVTQTYVNSLKASKGFGEAEQKEAFDKAKTKAMTMIGTDAKEMLTSVYGDMDEWVGNKIETYVKANKDNSCR